MWWKRKTELEKLVIEYGKDCEDLLYFAQTCGRERIEEIIENDIYAFYDRILHERTPFTAMSQMRLLRKFFREHRGRKCLRAQQITDTPLKDGELNAILPPMQKIKKRAPGRPIDWENVQRTVKMKDELGMSLRDIGKVIIKGRIVDHSQVFKWYERGKKLGKKKVGELSTAAGLW